jgi:butyryl-CoA dehydrogenase
VPYLKLWGTVAGGWQMARAALVAKQQLDGGTGEYDFYRAKLGTARFYAEHILPQAHAYRVAVVGGAASVLALEEAQF